MEQTYSIQVKRGEPDYGSSSIQIDGIAFGTSKDELDALVQEALRGMNQARQSLLNYDKKPTTPIVTMEKKAGMIMSGFTLAQRAVLKKAAEDAGKDPVTAILCAQEEGCETYDDFLCYMAEAKPIMANGKPTPTEVKK